MQDWAMAGGRVVSHVFFHRGMDEFYPEDKYSLFRTMEKGEVQLLQFSVVHQVKSAGHGIKNYRQSHKVNNPEYKRIKILFKYFYSFSLCAPADPALI